MPSLKDIHDIYKQQLFQSGESSKFNHYYKQDYSQDYEQQKYQYEQQRQEGFAAWAKALEEQQQREAKHTKLVELGNKLLEALPPDLCDCIQLTPAQWQAIHAALNGNMWWNGLPFMHVVTGAKQEKDTNEDNGFKELRYKGQLYKFVGGGTTTTVTTATTTPHAGGSTGGWLQQGTATTSSGALGQAVKLFYDAANGQWTYTT